MLTTYEAILRGNTIEWRNDAPIGLVSGQGIDAHVTILDEPVAAQPSQGRRMAEALEAIAQSRSLEGVDAARWECEERRTSWTS